MKLLASQIKCFISFSFPKPASFAFSAPQGDIIKLRGMGKWGADTRNAQKDKEDHLCLSMTTGRQQLAGGRTSPVCQAS